MTTSGKTRAEGSWVLAAGMAAGIVAVLSSLAGTPAHAQVTRTSAPASAPARTPSTTPATAPGVGKWYFYSAFPQATLLAATDTHLWFGPRGLFYYDLKTGQAHAITPLQGTHVDLSEVKCVSPSSDGRFVFPSGVTDYLVWSASKGLEPVAQYPQEGWFQWIGFDLRDRLLLRTKLQLGKDGEWFVHRPRDAAWEAMDSPPRPDDLRPAIPKQNGLKVSTAESGPRHSAYTITLEDGKTLPSLRAERFRRDTPYRDAKGNLWLGTWRWDGRNWQRVGPPELFPFLDLPTNEGIAGVHCSALDPRRCVLDERTMTWRVANPAGDPDVRVYDAQARRGIRLMETEGKRLLQEVEPAPAGWKVLREANAADLHGLPQVRDTRGDWWWLDQDKSGYVAVRFTETGLKTYPLKLPRAGSGPRQLVLSPKGRVWLWDWVNWQRFDEEQGTFLLPEGAQPVTTDERGAVRMPRHSTTDRPLEEFSFTFGPWTLSRIGTSGHWAGQVFVKKDGAWEPFLLPEADMTNYAGQGLFSGTDRMIHGHRMLLHWQGKDDGVYEYDLDTNRWEYLIGGSYNQAGYDSRGRVVIVTRYGILVYVRGSGPARPWRPEADPQLVRQFEEILRQLDDSAWRVREDATSRLIAIGRPALPLIRAELDAGRRSVEAQSRLRLVLEQIDPSPAEPLRPVPLLRRMHPYLTTRPAA